MASSHNHTLFITIITFLLFSISITFSTAHFSENYIEPITATRTEKTSNLHFYFQDIHSGDHPSVVKIIGDGLAFGSTFMMDNKLTDEIDRDSKIIGRAQGMYSLATQDDFAFLMVNTFLFTEERYNGSSISMLGRNHVVDDVREMPIVGGSGVFRYAKGYALAHTVWVDSKTGDASVEYNVTVNHY